MNAFTFPNGTARAGRSSGTGGSSGTGRTVFTGSVRSGHFSPFTLMKEKNSSSGGVGPGIAINRLSAGAIGSSEFIGRVSFTEEIRGIIFPERVGFKTRLFTTLPGR